MNWDTIQDGLGYDMESVRSKWGKLTDEDQESIAGKYESLVDALSERYGYAKDRAEKEVDDFLRTQH